MKTITLHKGPMSNKELADWFGVSEKTYSNARTKKLEELKNFADFDVVRGGIFVKEVLNPVYVRNFKKTYDSVLNTVDRVWAKDGLDSCARVSEKVKEKLQLPLADSTVYDYTRQSRDELYGEPFKGGGKIGSCEYLWCKKLVGENGEVEYRRLTPEEEEIKKKLMKKYFGDATEKQILIQGMVEAGEVKKEDAWELLTEWTGMKGKNFMSFLLELQGILGCRIIRGTLVERYNSFLEDNSGAF